MNIEHRIRKLEASDPNRHQETVVSLTVEEHELQEDVIRRHFGDEGPPDNTLLIIRRIVGPMPKPDRE